MSKERMVFIVTYKGDITKKLKKSKTLCPFRINADGNTEQSVDCFRGGGSSGVSMFSLARMTEPFILNDCLQIGEVISHKWVMMECK